MKESNEVTVVGWRTPSLFNLCMSPSPRYDSIAITSNTGVHLSLVDEPYLMTKLRYAPQEPFICARLNPTIDDSYKLATLTASSAIVWDTGRDHHTALHVLSDKLGIDPGADPQYVDLSWSWKSPSVLSTLTKSGEIHVWDLRTSLPATKLSASAKATSGLSTRASQSSGRRSGDLVGWSDHGKSVSALARRPSSVLGVASPQAAAVRTADVAKVVDHARGKLLEQLGKKERRRGPKAPVSYTRRLAWSRLSEFLIASASDLTGVVTVWDTRYASVDGASSRKPQCVLKNVGQAITTLSWDQYSPNKLFTGDFSGMLRLYDVASSSLADVEAAAETAVSRSRPILRLIHAPWGGRNSLLVLTSAGTTDAKAKGHSPPLMPGLASARASDRPVLELWSAADSGTFALLHQFDTEASDIDRNALPVDAVCRTSPSGAKEMITLSAHSSTSGLSAAQVANSRLLHLWAVDEEVAKKANLSQLTPREPYSARGAPWISPLTSYDSSSLSTLPRDYEFASPLSTVSRPPLDPLHSSLTRPAMKEWSLQHLKPDLLPSRRGFALEDSATSGLTNIVDEEVSEVELAILAQQIPGIELISWTKGLAGGALRFCVYLVRHGETTASFLLAKVEISAITGRSPRWHFPREFESDGLVASIKYPPKNSRQLLEELCEQCYKRSSTCVVQSLQLLSKLLTESGDSIDADSAVPPRSSEPLAEAGSSSRSIGTDDGVDAETEEIALQRRLPCPPVWGARFSADGTLVYFTSGDSMFNSSEDGSSQARRKAPRSYLDLLQITRGVLEGSAQAERTADKLNAEMIERHLNEGLAISESPVGRVVTPDGEDISPPRSPKSPGHAARSSPFGHRSSVPRSPSSLASGYVSPVVGIADSPVLSSAPLASGRYGMSELSMAAGLSGGDTMGLQRRPRVCILLTTLSPCSRAVGQLYAVRPNSSPKRDVSLGSQLQSICQRNGDVSLLVKGDAEAARVWDLMGSMLAVEQNDLPHAVESSHPWASHPMVLGLAGHLLEVYAAAGDVQMLSSLVSVIDSSHRFASRNAEPDAEAVPSSTLTESQSKSRALLKATLFQSCKSPWWDRYRIHYSNVLFLWGNLTTRCEVLKTMEKPRLLPVSSYMAAYTVEDHSIDRSVGGRPVPCTICCLPVRGLSFFCFRCHHGGHAGHMRDWLRAQGVCAAGCGCRCLETARTSLASSLPAESGASSLVPSNLTGGFSFAFD